MRKCRFATLTGAVLVALGAAAAGAAAATTPGSQDNILQAHVALAYNAPKRCPDLRPAAPSDAMVAVIVFRVGPSGVPSEPSIRASSGSAALDSAAVSCVMNLRFQPATSFGEGSPIASWQQIAWKWANPQAHPEGAAAASPAPTPPAAAGAGVAGLAAVAAGGTATAAGLAAAKTAAPGAAVAGAGGDGRAEVRVCVDASGALTQGPTLTHSSGDAAFDQAALGIARSGAGYYRPAASSGTSGCLRVTIRTDGG